MRQMRTNVTNTQSRIGKYSKCYFRDYNIAGKWTIQHFLTGKTIPSNLSAVPNRTLRKCQLDAKQLKRTEEVLRELTAKFL